MVCGHGSPPIRIEVFIPAAKFLRRGCRGQYDAEQNAPTTHIQPSLFRDSTPQVQVSWRNIAIAIASAESPLGGRRQIWNNRSSPG
jgi:hypothetical protein